MAYQNVGTPRFFIDNYQYLRAIGLDTQSYIDDIPHTQNLDSESLRYPTQSADISGNPIFDAFTLTPEVATKVSRTGSAERFFIPCSPLVKDFDFSGNMKWYGALLNSNVGDCIVRMQGTMFYDRIHTEGDGAANQTLDHSSPKNFILNNMQYRHTGINGSAIWYSDEELRNYSWTPKFTGFRLTGDGDEGASLDNFHVGSISMGVMYTMPHSPDLDLTMDVEMEGSKTTQTLGGSTLTNIRYTGSPSWQNFDTSNNETHISPFGLGEHSNSPYLDGAKRHGRRSWSLKFSYMSDKNLFPSNSMSNTFIDKGNITDFDESDVDIDNWGTNILSETNIDAQFAEQNTDGSNTITYDSNHFPIDFVGDGSLGTGIYNSSILSAGVRYKCTIDVTVNSGSIKINHSGTNNGVSGSNITQSGFYTFYFIAKDLGGAPQEEEIAIFRGTDGEAFNVRVKDWKVYPANPTDFRHNIFTDDSFIAQCWNKTLGGALPFIFQPDSNNNQADQFCLAKFDMDSLSVKQVAHKTYDVEVGIREVW